VIRLRFRGQAKLLVGAGIFAEAGLVWRPFGANEIEVEGLDALDDEQRGELSKLVRDPLPGSTAVHPPVTADDATEAVSVVGEAPPRAGQGSSRDAWAGYAARLTAAGLPVVVTDTMGRDEIVVAVDKAVEADRGS